MSYEHKADRWLREKRRRTGMTQQELADAAGLTVRDIQRIESGDTHLSYRKYLAIAVYFDVAMDEFLFGEVDGE